MTLDSSFSGEANRAVYSQWRASTFTLLFPGQGSDIRPMSHLQDELEERIRQMEKETWRPLWTYAKDGYSEQEKQEAKEALRKILFAAMYLHLDMKKHTTDMWFTSQDFHVDSKFDSKIMEEVIEKEGNGWVRLIVAPPLYIEVFPKQKKGLKVLRKAQVCTSELERLPRNGYEKAIGPLYTTESNHSRLEQTYSEHAYRARSPTPARRLSKASRRSSPGRRPL